MRLAVILNNIFLTVIRAELISIEQDEAINDIMFPDMESMVNFGQQTVSEAASIAIPSALIAYKAEGRTYMCLMVNM